MNGLRTYYLIELRYKTLLFLLVSLLSIPAIAQVEGNQKVMSSGGNEYNSPALNVTSTIGEAVVTTAQSGATLILTQGFQQSFEDDSLAVTVTTHPASCRGRANGFAFLTIDSILGCNDTISQVLWSAGTPVVGNVYETRNLDAGDYTVQIITKDNCSRIVRFSIGYERDGPCLLEFFSGITPNGDGVSDKWKIENVEAFAVNKVTIYNRLGNIVFEEDNYDNVNVVWDGTNLSGADLPSDTYFFVFESDGDFEKGWIELTRF